MTSVGLGMPEARGRDRRKRRAKKIIFMRRKGRKNYRSRKKGGEGDRGGK